MAWDPVRSSVSHSQKIIFQKSFLAGLCFPRRNSFAGRRFGAQKSHENRLRAGKHAHKQYRYTLYIYIYICYVFVFYHAFTGVLLYTSLARHRVPVAAFWEAIFCKVVVAM